MSVIAAGFLLGVAGSMHCVGMCGPLAMLSGRRKPGLSSSFAAHQLARIAVYLCFGAIAGAMGSLAPTGGWRDGLAIAAGAALIVHATGLIDRAVASRASGAIRAAHSRLLPHLPSRPFARSLVLGAVNGMLPCGLVYAATVAAAGFGNIHESISFMAAFGVGAVPAFGVLALSAAMILPCVPRRVARLAPLAIAIVGLLLVARGWPAGSQNPHALHHP